MSNNGDLKPEGPPTLFESQSETDENGHTRILASLEGRVGASGKAPQKKGRRYGIAAAVAVLVAGIGAWLVFSPSREPTPGPVAEQAAPAVQAGAQPVAPVAEAASVPVVAEAASAPPAAATIVNVETDEQRAPNKSAKEAPPPAKALAKAPAGEPHPAASAAAGNAAKTDDTAQGRAETAKLVAKSTLHADKDAPSAKAKPQSAAKPARNRKGALTADDPDADLLAALLAPHPANTGKAPNPPNHGGQ
ncbi:hypothetical protein ACNRBS_06360 [Ralstonia pseudosolanacearum]|uniref:hypothetical protein n=1 Tax=Ralstonia pseudosolanacearum TaxID=1310165 RepID=UPI0006BD0805|nr:hypothetical protein [Ralstonia pseudosolanacearum]AKZ28741.1 membrane protein [Ralstonia solanacearum]BCL94757.1 hypothetical protein MAFF211479_44580 [Ralstonia solanacearum]BCL99854.1 hypothetical protein MAFF211491_43060 [Ralstonia solanacearum]BCM15350.1 hypothetical protein MAFF241648_45400 [Ralstonia solanacearum]BCN07324.1 hypothetical protein RPSB_44610 [Ralstonia solanacearum]